MRRGAREKWGEGWRRDSRQERMICGVVECRISHDSPNDRINGRKMMPRPADAVAASKLRKADNVFRCRVDFARRNIARNCLWNNRMDHPDTDVSAAFCNFRIKSCAENLMFVIVVVATLAYFRTMEIIRVESFSCITVFSQLPPAANLGVYNFF